MKIRSKLFWLFIVLAATYASINLIAAPPRTSLQQYHVTGSTLRLLDFSVVGPIIIIWFIGLYAYQKLRAYTRYVAGHADGQPVTQLSRGVQFIVLWLPLNSTISTVLSLATEHRPHLIAPVVIAVNYIGLLLPLIGFLFFSKGARGLSEIVKQRPTWRAMNLMTLALILIGITYTYLVAKAHDSLGTIYHMPAWLVLLTIVAPYIFSWYLGLFAGYELHRYTFKIKGVIFKRSWNQLAFGIGWIILFSIVLQFIVVVTGKFAGVSLGCLLALTYGDIAILAVGYVLIALGSQKLMKIEEA